MTPLLPHTLIYFIRAFLFYEAHHVWFFIAACWILLLYRFLSKSYKSHMIEVANDNILLVKMVTFLFTRADHKTKADYYREFEKGGKRKEMEIVKN